MKSPSPRKSFIVLEAIEWNGDLQYRASFLEAYRHIAKCSPGFKPAKNYLGRYTCARCGRTFTGPRCPYCN